MTERQVAHIVRLKVVLCFIFLIAACNKPPTYQFENTSTLADRGRVSFKVQLQFEDAKGVQEVEQKLQQIKYALAMVFARKQCSDLEKKGKLKTQNSISSILEQLVDAKITRVALSDYHLEKET